MEEHSNDKKTHTIGIMTALADTEHPAVLEAFGILQSSEPHERDKDDRYWLTEIKRPDGATIKVVITCIAGSGNATPQIPVERMIQKFDPEAMFFVGIACGLRNFNLGDVVTSEVVWAYEYAKTQEAGDKDRSRVYGCELHLLNDVSFFSFHDEWNEDYRRLKSRFPAEILPSQDSAPKKLHSSIWIASGEKVMGDGKLEELNKEHDKIRAGEMEGYGFAQACKQHRPPTPWLVIRGISDYGDKTKDGVESNTETQGFTPKKDEYHLSSALAAASFLRKFLEKSYSPASDGSIRETRATAVGTLSDRQIKTMVRNGLLISDEYSEECVQQACYELRVGTDYYELGSTTKQRVTSEFGNVLLKPHQLTVVLTRESVNIPHNIVGRILTKGQLFSVGILPVNTYADPGFQGKLGIVMYNASHNYLKIPFEKPIAKIEFSQLSDGVEKLYSGQHGYQTEIWPVQKSLILSNADALQDTRVSSIKDELLDSYGIEIVDLLQRIENAERNSKLLAVAAGVCILGLLLTILLKGP